MNLYLIFKAHVHRLLVHCPDVNTTRFFVSPRFATNVNFFPNRAWKLNNVLFQWHSVVINLAWYHKRFCSLHSWRDSWAGEYPVPGSRKNSTLHQSSHGFATRVHGFRYQNKSTRGRTPPATPVRGFELTAKTTRTLFMIMNSDWVYMRESMEW